MLSHPNIAPRPQPEEQPRLNNFDNGDLLLPTEEKDYYNEEDSKVLHLKPIFEPIVRDFLDDIKKSKSEIISSIVDRKEREFGGLIGILLLVCIYHLCLLILPIICNKSSCDWKFTMDSIYQKTINYIDKEVALLYALYIALIYLVSLLPFGGLLVKIQTNKGNETKKNHRLNGIFSLFILLTLGLTLQFYLQISVFNLIYEKYEQLLFTATCFSVILSVILMSTSASDKKMYDFFMGCDVNPELFGIVLKPTLRRMCNLSTVILNLAFAIIKFTSGDYNITLLTCVLFICLYECYGLLFESWWLNTFACLYEKLGYMTCLIYYTYPFLITFLTKYIFEYNVSFANWQLGLLWTIFLIGFIINLGSNRQKYNFNNNPPTTHFESIPTLQGKKLLASGWWGLVRHPNYVGNLIMMSCLYSLAPCVPASLGFILSIAVLFHRTTRVNRHCRTRYGAAWERYCQRVAFNLIPKIF